MSSICRRVSTDRCRPPVQTQTIACYYKALQPSTPVTTLVNNSSVSPAAAQARTVWQSALAHLTDKIAPQNFDLWLRPIECLEVDGANLVLRAPNQYVRMWFEQNYLPAVLDALRAETGQDFAVTFAPDAEDPPRREPAPAAPTPPESAGRPRSRVPDPPAAAAGEPRADNTAAPDPHDLDAAPPRAALNPRYTFDTFVAGPSNQLAYAASQAAASTYPPKYNPVFICGGAGLGKTHLLHAIGIEIQRRRPTARIAYLSAERFMNEYIHAIRSNDMHSFRRRYREGCDVLLVDDVQFLSGKDGTQDEFFHTFNALHERHHQIVVTADRKPHEISDLAERLRTRFAWGLMADIEPPELEVRVAILRKKAHAEQIHLPDDVALFIATAIKSNVRELEGALIRLAAYASLSNRTIDLDFARETLEGSLSRAPEHITVDAVLKAVASYYGVKISDLKSPRRHKSIAGPRAVAMYLARQHTKDSYPDLGRAFGGKHHTTVISAVDKIARRLPTDPALRGELHAIEAILLR
ncbi:MAG: chromosomal replication initiator protein DnaA [Deltaproteobacteria bacterium]|nr:MAG: chromosomal replication initiator protein DnaA [Deltaproteobacteria bacterium]